MEPPSSSSSSVVAPTAAAPVQTDLNGAPATRSQDVDLNGDESSQSSSDSSSSSKSSSSSNSSSGSSSSSSEDPSEVAGVKIEDMEFTGKEAFTHDENNDEGNALESMLLKEHLPLNKNYSRSSTEDGVTIKHDNSATKKKNDNKRKLIIGRDRATVRRMLLQRVKGKGWDLDVRSKIRRFRNDDSIRDIPLHWHEDSTARLEYEHGSRNPGRNRWARHTKIRLFCCGMVSILISVVAMSFLILDIVRQKQTSHSVEVPDDDNFKYDDDEDQSTQGTLTEWAPSPKMPISSTPLRPPSSFPAPATTSTSSTPLIKSDDALLSLLKRSYRNTLHSIPPTAETLSIIDSVSTSFLDRNSNYQIPQSEQPIQWKSYQYLLQRNDIFNQESNVILMDEERILQIYAILCFCYNFQLQPGAEIGEEEEYDECRWAGVTCRNVALQVDEKDANDLNASSSLIDSKMRVVSLDAGGKGMNGVLPTELFFLTDLEVLDLSNNSIRGTLPTYVFLQWKNLKVLSLHDNQLEGEIPSELGKLSSLQKLALHHNEFQGEMPSEVCALRDVNLRFLWIDCSPCHSSQPKVPCPADCCTICFEGYSHDEESISSGTNPVSQVETPHIVVSDYNANLRQKLSEVSSDNGTALLDFESPQYHAYAWLVEDSDGQSYTDQKLYQRYALATLYFSTNGMQWIESAGWVSSTDECLWFGIVGCNDNDAIDVIELFGNNLIGILPPELFVFLPHIMVLNLATNHLQGSIPKEVGLLTSLNILELEENLLTSSIPSEIGLLKAVDHVLLQSNKLTGEMPKEVCSLRVNHSLMLLWADGSGSPPFILCASICCTTCFTHASIIDGEDNEGEMPLTHADPESSVLNKLKKMALDNGLSLEDTSSSQYMAYSWLVESDHSALTDVILLQRYALATLYFSTAGSSWEGSENWLTDKKVCPDSKEKVPAVSNWFGIMECDGGGMVTKLLLRSNNLRGTIPIELSYMRLLQVIDFSDNGLYGSIPTEFGLFQELETLRVSSNDLSGEIPNNLGLLFTLKELYLYQNNLHGDIPDQICDLKDSSGLVALWADCGGNTPAVACKQSCCTFCFDQNSDIKPFNNTIFPTYFPSPFPSASSVSLSPISFEDPGFKSFLLRHMHGFEDVLSDVSLPAYRAYLWLANTKNFALLTQLNKLQRFALVTLFLSTTSDSDWKNSSGWKTDLHECEWFGIHCADNETVAELSLSNNRMSGTLPQVIALVGIGGKIVKLNLSGNNIGGRLPPQLGNLTNLESLDLQANDFIGSIPSQLGLLSKLRVLHLHANELTGKMPSEVCSLRAMSLEEMIADCDPANKFDEVLCAIGTCCTSCY